MILLLREQYDDLINQRDTAIAAMNAVQAQYDALVKECVALKRHDFGMSPAGFDHTPEPLVGPMTELAIEEFSSGDRELSRLLTARAMAETSVRKATGTDQKEIDAEVAEIIRAGDQ